MPEEDDFTSSLSPYKVVDVYDIDGWGNEGKTSGNAAELECPRKDCGGVFIVNRQLYKECVTTVRTRACPYCFRVNLLPTSTA